MLALCAGAFLFIMSGCKNGMTRFKETPTGLKYKIIEDESGDVAQPGDYMKITVRTVVHDSVLMDTYKQGPGYQWLPLQKLSGRRFDLMEGLSLLSKGDSAEFVVPADSVMNPINRPPFVEKGDKIHFYVKVLDIADEEKYQSELAKTKEQQGVKDEQIIKSYLDSTHQQATRTENGVFVVVNKEGTGPLPQNGQEVSIMYTGKSLEGKPFDSNEDSSFHHTQPLTFIVGQGRTIPGMEEGVATLKEGADATLYIPSGLAYGPHGRPPVIMPNQVLVFHVVVKDISGEPAPNSPQGE